MRIDRGERTRQDCEVDMEGLCGHSHSVLRNNPPTIHHRALSAGVPRNSIQEIGPTRSVGKPVIIIEIAESDVK